ncbi:hypothetical protein [Flavobacterium hydatis]|uniref:Uncharacterized protein n=1 Tax=Flavobacterium hydatis TaxID=991 RepID=A0A086AND9_FLAHY|nr:hypothetical protein [Flavobacterium hydatis]KFF18203.1 hypothetical protein IW20_04680 [Flavobacterium hydatis]OXA97050.1 hypothetical protein B0A62_07335 [Flavobacterium hydatis]
MKNWIVIITFFYFGTLQAQKKLDILTTPTSPAASVLGMQPSAILQPKSYRALETALFSNFNDENGNSIIPNDFGLEFMPYWANDHGISLEEYLYPKANLDQLLRNSSFSLASTQNFMLQDSTNTRSLAFGYRTSIYFGNKRDKEIIQKHIKTLSDNQRIGSKILAELSELADKFKFKTKREYLTAIRDKLTNRIYEVLDKKSMKEAEEITKNIYDATDSLPFNENDLDSFFIAFSELIENKSMGSYDEFKSYILSRQGLSIDLAYALSLNFPTNDFKNSNIPRQSFWITPSYKFSDKISFLKATGVLRYEWYNKKYFENYFPDTNVYKNNFDYGLALSGQFKKFSLEFEATGRQSSSLLITSTDAAGNILYTKENTSDFQYIGTFSYRLTEQIALTYQIGSSFIPVFNHNGTLISLLSLNFGFGGPNVTDLTSK